MRLPLRPRTWHDRYITDADGRHVADAASDHERDFIIRAVNACAGVAPNLLTPGVLREAWDALQAIDAKAAGVANKVEGLAAAIKRMRAREDADRRAAALALGRAVHQMMGVKKGTRAPDYDIWALSASYDEREAVQEALKALAKLRGLSSFGNDWMEALQ